ncbi:hypothetical protein VMCG_04175 [Cytospora schulzeri]|uniref:Cytochrome P450 n=1 Tax=Cytospora schulzeri TaxID=448051 RepID=A0A423WUD1_9PEZI|nr:hypothetical protein VMCG_04175 [Valsa malicola]
MKNDLNKNMKWHAIQVYPKVLRCVARVNAKIFVGSNLHLNQEWIDITCSYVRNIFLSSAKLRFFPTWLRPAVQYFISELRAVWRCNARARDLLAPVLRERSIQEKSPGYTKPNDSIEWLRDLVPEPDRSDPHFHGISQLGISAVSVNTTSQLITNAILNLCTWPQYITILQEEIESVLKDNGGEWTLESMSKLQKLDSFLKETLRHSGHLTATFQRKALQPITLSDGTRIPPGTMTFAPTNAINFDPNIYPDPETFDGLRFYKLRQASEEEANKHQLTSITKTQLQFGSGRHACPGRWFAAHQNKLVLAAVIQRYEIKFKDGVGRPKGILFQTNQFPDPKAEVLFRARKGNL